MEQHVNMIAAIGHNRVIGKDGKLPWKIPADLQRFQDLTMGKPVIMGRKTYESIGTPLLGRTNIVISRDPDFHGYGILVVESLEEAFRMTLLFPEIFIIGGAQIYELALPYTDTLYLTWVDSDVKGDAHFPPYEHLLGECIDYTPMYNNSHTKLEYMFITYDLKKPL